MLGPLLADLDIKTDRMRSLAGANWAQATDLAAALVRHAGLDWRSAHQVVGVLVRRSIEQGIAPSQTRPAELDEAARMLGLPAPGLAPDIFADAMDPAAFVRRRKLFGGPAPEAVEPEIGAARARLAGEGARLGAFQTKLADAAQKLEYAITQLMEA